MVYLDVAKKLDARRDIAERALANYTEFKNALETGQPIFNYKFQNEPRKNSYLIAPVPMFHNALNSSTQRRERIEFMAENLVDLANQLSVLKELAWSTYSTNDLNATTLHVESVHLLYLCRQF
ncbi:hypothetical protein EGW08_016264, partial [Elysia chlorotica]